MRTSMEAHINLGGDDGIHVGDTLSVWRDQTVGKVTRNYRVGEVKVTKILGNNYASAEVVTGNVNGNDVVEMVRGGCTAIPKSEKRQAPVSTN